MIPSAANYDPAVTVQGQPIGNVSAPSASLDRSHAAEHIERRIAATVYACNYNPAASGFTECEYSSCLGCTVSTACNYDATAIYNDGSCEYTSCVGCTSVTACNYDAAATINDGSCDFTSCTGCTEPNADNYDATATVDDASCEYLGCTNTSACNYGCTDPAACAAAGEAGPNTDDGSCEFTSCAGCLSPGRATTTPPRPSQQPVNTQAVPAVRMPRRPTTMPRRPSTTAAVPSRVVPMPNACNYDASANVDDSSCTFAAAGFDCDGNCLT